MEEVLVPLGFFGVVPLIVWIVTSQRTKSHARTSETIQKMIERGDTITPETVQALGIRPSQPHRDLKVGLILIAVAISFFILGGVIPDDEAHAIFAGFASFPGLIGLVYCVFWFLFGRNAADN